MRDKIEEIVTDFFEIDRKSEIEFKQLYGFTFVTKKTIFLINDQVTSAEIKPLGIIYEENDEYYFAPLDEVDKKDEIIEKFVDKYLI